MSGPFAVAPRELSYRNTMDALLRKLAKHYETTPMALLEGLVALEYSLVIQETEPRQRMTHPEDKPVKSRVLAYAFHQSEPFTTRMASRALQLPADMVRLELNAVGWPSMTRDGVSGEVWMPLSR